MIEVLRRPVESTVQKFTNPAQKRYLSVAGKGNGMASRQHEIHERRVREHVLFSEARTNNRRKFPVDIRTFACHIHFDPWWMSRPH